MAKRKRDQASNPFNSHSVFSWLASKASSTGLTPIQCLFFSFHFHLIAHCSANSFFAKEDSVMLSRLFNDDTTLGSAVGSFTHIPVNQGLRVFALLVLIMTVGI